jgi:hypothetical protein
MRPLRPGIAAAVPTSPLWFQNDWVHAGLRVPGSQRFLCHERVIQAARDFYDARVIVPHCVYLNLMVALERSGPAHTDNPRFQGRDRSRDAAGEAARRTRPGGKRQRGVADQRPGRQPRSLKDRST